MKRFTKQLIIATTLATIISGCEMTPEGILKNYENYSDYNTLPHGKNNINFSVTFGTENEPKRFYQQDIIINFSDSLFRIDTLYRDALVKRIFVADAETGKILDVLPDIYKNKRSITYTGYRVEWDEFIYYVQTENIKPRFFIIGFMGISAEESEKYETSPMFFIVDKKTKSILTPTPLLSDNLFAFDFSIPQFIERYSTLKSYYEYDGKTHLLKEYVLKLGDIGNEEISTYVDILSNAIKKEDWKEGDYYYSDLKTALGVYFPLYMEIFIDNIKYQITNYGVMDGSVRYRFQTKSLSLPDSVIVYSTTRETLKETTI